MGIKILISWLGNSDLKAAGQIPQKSDDKIGKDSILEVLTKMDFDELHLLHEQEKSQVDIYCAWLSKHTSIKIILVKCALHSPLDFSDMYQTIDNHLNKITVNTHYSDISFHLSPDRPSMTAISILLGTTRYNSRFIQSYNDNGADYISIPFDLSKELPHKIRQQQSKPLNSTVPLSTTFSDIITQNPEIKKIKRNAKKIAARNVPVLIIGNSGTGKEMFAKAIHNSSLRKGQAFIAINCSAIPKELIDSELFGLTNELSTGTGNNTIGYFELADGGTLFLNECDELPPDAQVRILRILQSGEISKRGDKPKQIDVRIIAATNRNLSAELAQGYFREDLFYRVAIGIISLPVLKDRIGDIELLTDYFMEKINQESSELPDYRSKILSEAAKKVISDHSWQGNIRELQTTLLRATLWAEQQEISKADIHNAILERPRKLIADELPEIGTGIDINKVLDETRKKYVSQALKQTAGHKRKAAKLLNLTNYQTLTNWIEKLDIQ